MKIENEKQYNLTMERIEQLLKVVDEDTPEEDEDSIELVRLSTMAADYEEKMFPIPKSK